MVWCAVKRLAWFVVMLSALCASACRDSQRGAGRTVSADEFALYAVRPEPDSDHNTPVTMFDGSNWYRNDVPGFNLRHVRLRDVSACSDPRTLTGIVVVPLKNEHWNALSEWMRARMGQSVGFVFRGRVVGRIVTVVSDPRGQVVVRTPSEQEAERLAAEIKALDGLFD